MLISGAVRIHCGSSTVYTFILFFSYLLKIVLLILFKTFSPAFCFVKIISVETTISTHKSSTMAVP